MLFHSCSLCVRKHGVDGINTHFKMTLNWPVNPDPDNGVLLFRDEFNARGYFLPTA